MDWKTAGLLLAFLAAWIVLNRWVLPWFGVPTCMSGGCAAEVRRTEADPPEERGLAGPAEPGDTEQSEDVQDAQTPTREGVSP
jgi:hypothetical protein